MTAVLKKKCIAMGIFAIAFAFVEAAVVFYIREIFGISNTTKTVIPDIQPMVNFGIIAFLKFSDALRVFSDSFILQVEMIREFATLLMLGSAAYLASKSVHGRIWMFLYVFSLWDIFYYIFLRIIIGWPTSFLDIDIFFLLPVPWVGPVLLPWVLFSLLLLISVMKLNTMDE